MSAEKYERFVRWYLRFNGYFTVENFIVHAGGDKNRIRNGVIAPHTETDVLAIRMPYSHEVTGQLHIANHSPLINGQSERFDVVIAEAKSGNSNKPNPVWRNKNLEMIAYIVRFIGLCKKEEEIQEISSQLADRFVYDGEKFRIRYILFSEEVNEFYRRKGVSFITYGEIIKFLVSVRGESWIDSGIGIASIHNQWDDLINQVLVAANNFSISEEHRLIEISALLNS
jgi:hypothetical protein